ncbi:uncharacterized protein LOC127653650 [Xyrauchen texanus]|uniref:uncharacterized protein LOC127653650 n=1 Tax=Xyrauchen texanus TaxID=154827 RepID=UPI002241E90E|nr:uncharacterized protein LOC127653650 [Xyrauchen texanus]
MTNMNVRNLLNKCFLVFIKKKPAFIIRLTATKFDTCVEENCGKRRENSWKQSSSTMSRWQMRSASLKRRWRAGSLWGGDSLIWPWEVHSSESSNILTKKKIFDVHMSKVRLQEEKIIVMREMRQHCTYLRKLSGNIRTRISDMSFVRNSGSLSEEGHGGLLCLLQKRLADVKEKFQVICSSYSLALGPNAASLLENGPEEMLEDHEEVDYESSDDSDFEAV